MISLRENVTLDSFWTMVARTAFAQLNDSWPMLAVTVLGMAILYIAPPYLALRAFFDGALLTAMVAAAAWGLMAHTFWPTARLYGQTKPLTALLPVAGALYTAMTISSAWRHAQGDGGRWKGRTY